MQNRTKVFSFLWIDIYTYLQKRRDGAIVNIDDMKIEIISKIRDYFDNKKINYKDGNFETYINQWLDISDKVIVPKKRNVIYSKELEEKIKNNKINEETIELIKKFKLKFEVGEDICQYLSKNITDSSCIDNLLTIWRIHHLHLTDELKENFSKRSDKYILFLIHNDIVYFLDQTKHLAKEEFASKYFIELLANNNWLHFVSIYPAQNVVSTNYEINSDAEMYKLWTTNVNCSTFKIGDSYYTNLNGKTCGGTSLQNQNCIIELNKFLFKLSESSQASFIGCEINSNLMQLAIYFSNNGIEYKLLVPDNLNN